MRSLPLRAACVLPRSAGLFSLRRLLRFPTIVAAGLVLVLGGDAIAARLPAAPVAKSELPRKVARQLANEISSSPADVQAIVGRYLREFPAAATAIARVAAAALPEKDGQPDAALFASLARFMVELIYNDLPTARTEVKGVVFAFSEALALNGDALDPRGLVLLLEEVLPAILTNDPALARVLFPFFLGRYPDAVALLIQLRTRFNSALAFVRFEQESNLVELNPGRVIRIREQQKDEPGEQPVASPGEQPPATEFAR
jgi:hypothetical protein